MKGGGKNGRYGSVDDTSTIGAVSYIGVQVFEYRFSRQFRPITKGTATYQTVQYAQLPSHGFLCLLTAPPREQMGNLAIDSVDGKIFKELLDNSIKLREAVKMFRKRTKKGDSAECDDDDD